MIEFSLYNQRVEIDLTYTCTDDVDVSISGNTVTYYGSVEDDVTVDVEINVADFVEMLSGEAVCELKEYLNKSDGGVELTLLDVDEIFEGLDKVQHAILFNKMLKHETYNPKAVSLARVAKLLDNIALSGRDIILDRF